MTIVRRRHVTLGISAVLSIGSIVGCGGGGSDAPETKPGAVDAAARPEKKGGSRADMRQIQTADDMPTVATADMQAPPLEVVPPVLDFGFIAPNEDAKGSVQLFNRGTEPMLILAAEPSCKCTTLSDLGGTVIEPGGMVEMEAMLEGAPNTGPKTASIKVLIDGYAVVKTIDLKAEIALPIRAVPPHINAVRGQNRQGRIVVQSNDGRPFSICALHGQAPRYLGFDPATDQPAAQYVLLYDLDRIAEPFPRYLVIETDQEDVPVVDVYLRHESTLPRINQNLRMKGGYRFPLGRIAQGGSTTLEVPFDSLTRPLAAIISTSPEAQARMISTRTEEAEEGILTYALVEITPTAAHQGLLYLKLEAMTDTGETAGFDVFGVVVPDGSDCAGPTVTDASTDSSLPETPADG
jgi:hypothetical protein